MTPSRTASCASASSTPTDGRRPRYALDADQILAAAQRAVQLWPEIGGDGLSYGSSLFIADAGE
jgi:hypothetical protein